MKGRIMLSSFVRRTSLLLLIVMLVSSCTATPLKISFDETCLEANSGKTITTEGYLVIGRSLFCSSDRNGYLRCSLYLLDEPREPDFSEVNFSINILQGTGNHQIEPVERGFTEADIRMRDADGDLVNLDEAVQVTGWMLVGADSCQMDVNEILQPPDE
jgi:hypothetical protein